MPCVPVHVENDRNQIAHPTTSPSDLGDVGECRRLPPDGEQRLGQLILRRVDLVQRLLVLGELTDEPEDDRHVPGGGTAGADAGGRRTAYRAMYARPPQWGA